MSEYYNPSNVPLEKIPEGWRLPREDELLPMGSESRSEYQMDTVRPWAEGDHVVRIWWDHSGDFGRETETWGVEKTFTQILPIYRYPDKPAEPVRPTKWPSWDRLCQ